MTGLGLRRSTSWAVLLAFFTSLTACGGGKETAPPPTTTLVPTTLVPTTVVPTTAPAPTLPAQPPEQLSKQQLRELVAPVALYPDVVLASLLPATTYPEQVTDAAGWVRQQNGQVQAVPDDRNWDGSVAGLLQFPDVLNWLDQNQAWEDQMGTAMTYQQGDVLQAIQDYRQEALNAGNLKSNEYMKVSAQPNEDIRIAPAQPDVVYVPQYDTQAVTQPQQSTGINPWLAFGGGAVVGALGAWALYSIFDDDDDGHHGGGHKKVVKHYNNYYYSGSGNRPQPVNWQPRDGNRRQRLRSDTPVARPGKVEPVYTTRTAAQKPGGAVRPPKQGNAGGKRGGMAQPTTAPPVGSQETAAPTKRGGGGGGHKQGGGGGGQKQKQGGGQKQHQQNTQQNHAPSPAPTAAPSSREAAPQQVQQKKQGGGGGGKQGGGQNQQNKKKNKKKEAND